VFVKAHSLKLTLVKDSALYSESICGKSVSITNTQTGQSITVVVADECPTCENANSIDLSHTAFGALTDSNFAEGVVPIQWYFID
jgi:rare lipoprotein A (peptidoglycan hydrolase)